MKQKKKKVNYRNLLFLGVSLFSVGLIYSTAINPAFICILVAGLGLIAIALTNREKWVEANHKIKRGKHE